MCRLPRYGKTSHVWVNANDVYEWVNANDVYDVTNFLADHHGGKNAIMLFAGKDATEEFDMLHDRKVMNGLGVGNDCVDMALKAVDEGRKKTR